MKGTMEVRGWTRWARLALAGGALAAGIALLPLIASRAAAQETTSTYSVLYSFTGGADGWGPIGDLTLDGAGNLYGTTDAGGNLSYCSPIGCGVVFKLDPAGNETVLHTFTGGADGADPFESMIRDGAGNLYGTTAGGGNLSYCSGFGCGVVFKLDPAGNETVLYAFTGGADGRGPGGGLITDGARNLYGVTEGGGNTSSLCGSYGCGVVFKLDPSGNESVLHTFTGGADGWGPAAGLIRDGAGNLYGTTGWGGNMSSSSCPEGSNGCGVVFKLDPAANETVLYTFTGGADGAFPSAGLIRDAAGNLYGTTSGGGNMSSSCPPYGCGVVFKLDPSGNETVLHAFTGGLDGGNPFAGLILDASGNLGGTTYDGSSDGGGVVFRVSQKGNEIVLHTFTGPDGYNPWAGLIQDRAGNAYGTTSNGGTYGYGAVYKLSPP